MRTSRAGYDSVILTQRESSVRTGENQHVQDRGIAKVVDIVTGCKFLQRNDATRFSEHRYAVKRAPHFKSPPGRVIGDIAPSIEEVVPFALRQPCFSPATLCRRIVIGHDGCHQQFGTESEFVWHFVGLRIVRFAPIHRFDQRPSVKRRTIVHRVQVRQQHMAQSQ